jgi:hypothetical protein
MQKSILLLPLLCLVFCSAQEVLLAQAQSQSLSYGHNPAPGAQVIYTANSYPCPDNYYDLTTDSQLFNDIVCVKTWIQRTTVVKGDCPAGSATISYNEVSNNTNKYCRMLGRNEVARIGFMGSLSGSNSNCALSDFDTSDNIAHSICVQSGDGQVLVTPQEALANQNAYCALLGDYDIIRLANGGSMDGPGYGCKIRYEDRRDLGGVLCRNLSNN